MLTLSLEKYGMLIVRVFSLHLLVVNNRHDNILLIQEVHKKNNLRIFLHLPIMPQSTAGISQTDPTFIHHGGPCHNRPSRTGSSLYSLTALDLYSTLPEQAFGFVMTKVAGSQSPALKETNYRQQPRSSFTRPGYHPL